MATLSLKKPHPKVVIGETPFKNIHGMYAVMRQSRSIKSMRFTCIHDSLLNAIQEADRLALQNKTERYLVVRVVCSRDWVA
jgi:hypothetical protein